MKLSNKVVIITGASRGFGKSLAAAFAKEGCRVVISSNDKRGLEKAAQDLAVDYKIADVTKPDDLENLGKYVFDKYGVVDIWINNAGVQIAPGLAEEVDLSKLQRLFDINFFGYFYGCQTALRLMKKQRKGTIININSTAGLSGKPSLSAYVSSKFAIKGLTESIRQELTGTELQIYSVHPGGMQTDIYRERYPDDFKDYMPVDMVTEKVIANLKSSDPELDLIIKRPISK
jgi:NAD(P)-dependent dehydrogenase (short-subunit alcohol dehydrogenase family)